MFRERNFLKLVSQFGDLLKKIRNLRRSRKYDEVTLLLDGARQDLIGVPRSLLEGLDPPSCAALIADPTKIRVWAKIVREEGLVLKDKGLDPSAQFTQATGLMQEAIARSEESDEDRALFAEWAQISAP